MRKNGIVEHIIATPIKIARSFLLSITSPP